MFTFEAATELHATFAEFYAAVRICAALCHGVAVLRYARLPDGEPLVAGKNRQGNDVGLSYRSAIYYTSDEQKRVAAETIADVDASGLWPGKAVTEVEPAGPFWEAEPEHQDYLQRYPQRLHLPLGPAELEAGTPPRRVLAPPPRPRRRWRHQQRSGWHC
jgi:Peptide methionine sulfoxide reductase